MQESTERVMRVVFMGSPAFGVPTLERLLRAGHEVTLVVTRPDRPAGRSGRPTPPAVARFAHARGLALYQPERLRSDSALEPIRQAAPDFVVVAAYGLLLPQDLLGLPRYGCLNVHPSLLPRHRGASPVQATLLAGDAETGVTIMQLTERMDAGPIIAQIRTPVETGEDALSLGPRLADLGAQLLVDCLQPWAEGRLPARPQDESKATYCPRLERADAELEWSRPAADLVRVVRAFRGRTDAFTFWDGRRLKVLRAEAGAPPLPLAEPGKVFETRESNRPRRPLVATGDGFLALCEVALEGRSATTGEAFLNGYPAFIGAYLGKI